MPNARMLAGLSRMPRPRRRPASPSSARCNSRSVNGRTVFMGNPPVTIRKMQIDHKPAACGQVSHELLVAHPILRAAQEGEADEPAYLELLPAILHYDQGFVHLAVVRVEDLAAGPLVAIFPEIPKHAKSDQWLALQLALTTVAPGVRVFR